MAVSHDRSVPFLDLKERYRPVQAHENRETISNITEDQTAGRLFNPEFSETATSDLVHQVRIWQQERKTVVLVFGGFDAPFHPDHQAYLLDCKLQGVAHHFNQNHGNTIFRQDWTELDRVGQEAYARIVLEKGEVKLIVSTDGDTRIAASKSNNPEKGGSTRPLQAWQTRAHNLAHFTLRLSGSPQHTPIVDAITVHDHIALPDTPHRNPQDLAAALGPDVWVLYHEAEEDIRKASQDPRLLSVNKPVITGRGYNNVDPLTGEPFSTTALVKRVRGEL